jgi:hypothetical protein
MKNLLKPISIALFLTLAKVGYTQKVTVLEGEEKADNLIRSGFYTILELDETDVKKEWAKRLKDFGSVKTKSGIFIIDEAKIAAFGENPLKIYSKTEQTVKGTKVWMAVDMGTNFVTEANDATKAAEVKKILKDFGINMYIADINEQIKEAEKVLASSVKEQEKQILKGENIKASISKNRNTRISLEKKIVETDSLYKILKADSLQNIQNQKAAAENVEKMKRAVEIVKAKITKVE